MEMEIEMISCENVKPFTATPPHLQTYQLCMLDQLHPPSLISTLFFYEASNIIRSSDSDQTQTTEQLKIALSHTLTRFYPVAGRGSGDNATILCNDDGVPFLVAKVKGNLILQDLQEAHPGSLLPCPTGFTIEWGPGSNVAMIQVTHFGCGGVAVGVIFWHKLGDATTVANFMKDWAACTSSPGAPQGAGPDYNIPRSLFPPKQELQDVSHVSLRDYVNKGVKYLMRRYVFNGSAIRRLKAEASNVVESPSRVEVVTALLWKCYMVASLANDKQASSIIHAVNLRRPTGNPPIPSSCFGNLITEAAGSCTNISPATISSVALVKQTRDMIRKVDDEHVKRLCGEHGLLGFNENRKNTFSGVRVAGDCLNFSSWCGVGFYDVDFGWGKPIWIRNCNFIDSDSGIMNTAGLMDTGGHGDGSVEACLIMEERYIHVFDNIQLLQEYRSSTSTTN